MLILDQFFRLVLRFNLRPEAVYLTTCRRGMRGNIVESNQSTRRNKPAVKLEVLFHILISMPPINEQKIDLPSIEKFGGFFQDRLTVGVATEQIYALPTPCKRAIDRAAPYAITVAEVASRQINTNQIGIFRNNPGPAE